MAIGGGVIEHLTVPLLIGYNHLQVSAEEEVACPVTCIAIFSSDWGSGSPSRWIDLMNHGRTPYVGYRSSLMDVVTDLKKEIRARRRGTQARRAWMV
jgi:hypothetical protein